MSIIRTRWAAIGAAVAVTLGAGGIGIVSATQPDDAVTFVPITPCRVMDTRTEFNVGPKTSPLGPDEVYTVNTTTADTGNCTGIPATATGVSLNITAVDATMPTFLTIWATGEAQPTASSLNPVPGQPPTPNAVTTAINPDGQFDIYNLQGNVHVIADINGYYTDHHHDDRYYTKDQTYTKDEIDARTIVRNISFPALAINETSASAVIEHVGNGLEWENSFTEGAELFIRQPSDWTGTGDVVLRLMFRRANSNPGNVQFFARPRDYNDNEPFLDTVGINSDIQDEANTNFQEVTITIPAASLPNDWWDIVIQRNSSGAGAYPDPVTVLSADLEYEARR